MQDPGGWEGLQNAKPALASFPAYSHWGEDIVPNLTLEI